MKSIASKLWLGMMFLVGIVLVLLWLFQIVFLENFYSDIRLSEVKTEGLVLVQAISSVEKTEMEARFDQFAQSKNLTVELLKADGTTVYSSGGQGMNDQMPMMMMMSNARNEAFREVLTGKEVAYSLTHPRFNSKFELIGLPVMKSGKVQEVLLLNIPMAPVNETVAILKKQLSYITVILLVIAIATSYILARMLTKPIIEITRVSSKMAAGDLTARISLKNRDEIGKLAGTINHMGQELSKLDQLRKDLVANVSHELRTPLSLIRGYAETIRDVSGDDTVKRQKHLGIIVDETERLGEIVNDILNLSQMQAGYHTLNKKPFPVRKLLANTVKRFEVLGNEAQVAIIASLNIQEQLLIEGDETRLEQVLYNLIYNAVNHSPPGTTVVVKGVGLENKVRIEVSDTGTGIPEEDLKYIWDRFYKADKTGSRKNSGSGLGLAIVKNILEAHGFDYGVDSQLGRGTTFWFEATVLS